MPKRFAQKVSPIGIVICCAPSLNAAKIRSASAAVSMVSYTLKPPAFS